MLISLNELKQLVDIKIPDDELFKLIGSRLVEIEHVEDLAPKYKKIYIVKVKSAEPIEGTHLHLCQIDAGKELNSTIDPEHDGYVQVVCGAPNVKKGMLTAWVAPGAIVPATFGTAEPFEISARPLRGFMSYGMLAAADELALNDDHGGIVSISPDHVILTEDNRLRAVRPGDTLAQAFDLNDKIIEVENKSLTHRPDCFGLIGFAREVAGILGEKFEYSDKNSITIPRITNPVPLSVQISDYKICPRYEAHVIDLGGTGLDEYVPMHLESDEPVTDFLKLDDIFFAKAGMRSISPLVDVTNKIMLMTGQPLHAFDYDKFVAVGGTDAPEIRVRLARKGEKLVLLDDKEIELNEHDIIICSGDTPVALAGAMGGKSTAIDNSTRRVIFEIASFSLYNLRKTQMSHGIFSEAITRFTKGRPATDLDSARHMLFDELKYFVSNEPIASVIDTDPALIQDNQFIRNVVKITTDEINALLGTSYPEELIIKTLENTGFEIKSKNNVLEITAPLWRTDIHIKEDIIEEVGRLLGFDNIPFSFPLRPFVCPTVDPMFDFKSKLRIILSDRLGMNELLTYSFVSKNLQEKVNENPADSYQIINSISPALECFRQSLVPSLLDKIRENEKAGFKDFSLYELNQVSKKSWGLNEENVPKMQTHLGLTTFGDYYTAKQVLRELEKSLSLNFELRPLNAPELLEPLHAVAIYLNDTKVGELGEIKRSVLKRFKLDNQTIAAIELNLDACLGAKTKKKFGIKLSKFPFVSRDLTFRVPETANYADFETKINAILSKISGIIYKLEVVSIYHKENESTKNLSFHLDVASEEKTLESSEVSEIIDTIVKELKTLGAEVV